MHWLRQEYIISLEKTELYVYLSKEKNKVYYVKLIDWLEFSRMARDDNAETQLITHMYINITTVYK